MSHNKGRQCFLGVILLLLISPYTVYSEGSSSTVSVYSESELYKAVEDAVASGVTNLIVSLSADKFELIQPLVVPRELAISLQGAVSGGSATVLQCASSNISLIERHGDGNLTVSYITLSGCNRPGILVHPGSSASILIERCYFTNFSRTLEPGRVSTSEPGKPEPISSSTAALAIHATGFTGSIRIRDTVFTDNWFQAAEGATPPAEPLKWGYGQPAGVVEEEDQVQSSQKEASLGGQEQQDEQQPPSAVRRRRAMGDREGTLLQWKGEPQRQEPLRSAISALPEGSAVQRTPHSSRQQGPQGPPQPSLQQPAAGRGGRRTLQQQQDLSSPGASTSTRYVRDLPGLDNIAELLLSYAAVLDPGAKQEGPWADDMEAVVSVTCEPSGLPPSTAAASPRPPGPPSTAGAAGAATSATTATCSVDFERVRMVNNTGVATSGLYVMCDGMKQCEVRLTDCELHDNKLLWQPAIDPANLPQPGNIAETSGYDYETFEPKFKEWGTGTKLFEAMMPWLTYTYPIIYAWKTGLYDAYEFLLERFGLQYDLKHYASAPSLDGQTGSFGGTSGGASGPPASAGGGVFGGYGSYGTAGSPATGVYGYGSDGSSSGSYGGYGGSEYSSSGSSLPDNDMDDTNRAPDDQDSPGYPTLTGRTLGVVVIHQRNSPYPGARRDQPAMVTVSIEGGEYSGNDGAVFMNTATDWMRIAGGYGDWLSADLPRHSADYTLSGLNMYNHTSGMPAVLLRWARSVHVTNTAVVDSTGSIWLEEVRDSASIDGCYFARNILPEQRWIYYWSFMSLTPAENPRIEYGEGTIGGGSFQVVMLQMTPLGLLWSNEAVVRNSVFEDNPSYVMGALYIVASDKYAAFADRLPGKTFATVEYTNFTRNYCRRLPPGVEPTLEFLSSGSKCLTGERPLYGINLYQISVIGCRFEDNRAGGLFVEVGQRVQLLQTYFANNINTYAFRGQTADRSSGGGAATFISMSKSVIIKECTFINNTSPPGGGAVMAREFYVINVYDSRFEGNTASYSDGGALLLFGSLSQPAETSDSVEMNAVKNTTFRGNFAGRRGGAICASSVGGASGDTFAVEGSSFEENTANLLPLLSLDHPLNKMDQAGGGAFYCEKTYTLTMTKCNFTRNKVFRHAGGGARIVDIENSVMVSGTRFEDNVAIMGGAISMTRVTSFMLGGFSSDDMCFLKRNSVIDPWAWPETSQLPHARNDSIHTPLVYLKPGFGGAVAWLSADLSWQGFSIKQGGVFEGNKALVGGAIGVMQCSVFSIDGFLSSLGFPWYNLTVQAELPEVAALKLASLDETRNAYTIPYKVLFQDNSAVLGGAIYLKDTRDVNVQFPLSHLKCDPVTDAQSLLDKGFVEYPELLMGYQRCFVYPDAASSISEPGVLFYNNTGSGGGAIYIDGSDKVLINKTAFVANSVGPLLTSSSSSTDSLEYLAWAFNQSLGVTGVLAGKSSSPDSLEYRAWTLNSRPCFGGRGGALCISGNARSVNQIVSSVFLHNNALLDGGAVYVDEGNGCISPAQCYKVSMGNVTLAGNRAIMGRGGGVCWRDEGIFNVQECKSDISHTVSLVGAADPNSTQNVQVLFPQRKPPAVWYQTLKWEYKQALLKGLGGPVNASGQLPAFGTVAFEESLRSYVASAPGNNSLLSTIVYNDSAWKGMPYTELGCADWQNNTAASGGQDLGSTPYFLVTKPIEDFYKSNTELELNVTVHDWYGNNCSTGISGGDALQPLQQQDQQQASQPVIVVRARPLIVSGPILPSVLGASEVVAVNGTARFSNFRVRAQAGPWDIAFRATMTNPDRELQPAQIRVIVRQCIINEYLDPDSHDVCFKCDIGYFNMNSTGDKCSQCPDGAECGYPGDGMGFLVPKDSTWHSNFFSSQILECPNEKSCKRPNRSSILAGIQVKVWNITLDVLKSTTIGNASDDTTSPARRVLLQELRSAYAASSKFFINASTPYLPEYMSSQCAEGYTGALCGECEPGYGWVNVATCIRCPDQALNSLYYTLATLLTVVSLAVTIKASVAPAQAKLTRLSELRHRASKLRFHERFDDLPFQTALEEVPEGPDELAEGERPDKPEVKPNPLAAPSEAVLDDHSKTLEEPHLAQPTQQKTQEPQQVSLDKPQAPPPGTAALQEAKSTPLPGSALSPSDRTGDPAQCGNLSASDKAQVVVEVRPPSGAGGPVAADCGAPASISRNNTRDRSARHAHSFARSLSPVRAAAPLTSVFADMAKDQHANSFRAGSSTSYEDSANISTIIRIAISYLQVLSLLGAIPISFYNIIDIFLGICSQATSYPGALVSLDCSLPGNLGISKAMMRVLLGALAPAYATLAFIILTALASMLSYSWKKLRRQVLPHGGVLGYCRDVLNRHFLVMVSTIMFFFYPSVSQILFSIFYCQDVSEYDMTTTQTVTRSVWQLDFGEECYKGPHLALALALGVPGLLLFGLGWPILSAVLVVRHLRKESGLHKTTNSGKKFEDSMETLADYKARWIWWESVTLLRQLAIAAVVTFVGDKTSAAVQLLIIFFLLVAAVVAQTLVQPYRVQTMGTLAVIALYGLMATVYLLLFLSQLDDNDTGGKITVSIIVVVVNFLLILTLATVVVQTYWFGLLESSGLSSVDPDARRSMTFHEVRSLILTRIETTRASSGSLAPALGTPAGSPQKSSSKGRQTVSDALGKLNQAKLTGIANTKAALFIVGTHVGNVVQQVRSARVSSASLPNVHSTRSTDTPKSARTTQSSVVEAQPPLATRRSS